jgi:polar amino acid transport system permease protein
MISRTRPSQYTLSRWPWWALLTAFIGVLLAWQIATDSNYLQIFRSIIDGVGVTVGVTLIAFGLSLLLGLLLALARLSKNVGLYQVSTFIVENIRGIPMLVLLLYVAFVFMPGIIDFINGVGQYFVEIGLTGLGDWLVSFRARDISNTARVIVALVIAYSVFISEIYRAGIASIDRGQMEAAQSLGMTRVQAMITVILPQAIRNVLPALGNDFIAMLKDSSLVSVLGVQDITGLGRVYAAGNFQFFETYNVMTFLYLSMTLLLSMGVRWLERWSSRDRAR